MNQQQEEVIKPHSKFVRLFFFWTGIIATIAYRIIIVLNYYSSLWVSISWYLGTAGFIIYFWHRYDIAKKKINLVKDYNLVEVVDKAEGLEEKQKSALRYLVQTTLTSKSKWNAGFIFILSSISLVVGIIMDIISLWN